MERGTYTRHLPNDYCVLDLETTGLEPEFCEIIEVAIAKVRDGKIVDTYTTLVKPHEKIDEFIENLTGITNEMVKDAPRFKKISDAVFSFIGDDFIIGHNVSFDLRFLSNESQREFVNPYYDSMLLGRKLVPDLAHHRLKELCDYYGIKEGTHRALADVEATYNLFEAEKDDFRKLGIEESEFFRPKSKSKQSLKALEAQDEALIDEDNFFYGTHCCFTGALSKLTRHDAAQMLINIGGYADDSITKKTDYLIMGSFDYNANIKGNKTGKYKKAEELQAKGSPIQIIAETSFYEFMGIK